MVELIGGESVINGASPSSFHVYIFQERFHHNDQDNYVRDDNQSDNDEEEHYRWD